MKTKVLISIVTAVVFCLANPVQAQMGNCDSLQILDIQLNPFDPNYIMVRSAYTDFDNFINLPTFTLVDENEFILAMEELNFFGMSLEQIHALEIIDLEVSEGVAVPATLELWSVNFENLECTVTDDFMLWPVQECVPVMFSVSLMGEDSLSGNMDWKISDAAGNVHIADTFSLDTTAQLTNWEVCLPIDCGYEVQVNTEDFQGLAVSYSLHYRNALAIGVGGWLDEDGSYTHPFNLYNCETTSIEESNDADIQVFPNPANSRILIEGAGAESRYQLYDLHGKLLQESDANEIDVSGLQQGMYIITILTEEGEKVQKRVVVGR